MLTPKQIVGKMMAKDNFSHWLGVNVNHIDIGTSSLSCVITKDMLNGFEITHGGISYSLAYSALAFAANSYVYKCVSIETSISHTRPTKINDTLIARCKEINRSKRIGLYEVSIINQDEKLVAFFKGTVSISEEVW